METILNLPWSTIFMMASVLVLLVSAGIHGVQLWSNRVPANQKADMLHRALKVAVAAASHETDNPATPEMVADMVNRFLGIYHIPVKVNAEEVKLLLIEANLILTNKLPPA